MTWNEDDHPRGPDGRFGSGGINRSLTDQLIADAEAEEAEGDVARLERLADELEDDLRKVEGAVATQLEQGVFAVTTEAQGTVTVVADEDLVIDRMAAERFDAHWATTEFGDKFTNVDPADLEGSLRAAAPDALLGTKVRERWLDDEEDPYSESASDRWDHHARDYASDRILPQAERALAAARNQAYDDLGDFAEFDDWAIEEDL